MYSSKQEETPGIRRGWGKGSVRVGAPAYIGELLKEWGRPASAGQRE